MLYKLVVIFFAAAHGLPGAYKKRAKSAERLHALERTTGPKCCECEISREFTWKMMDDFSLSVPRTECWEQAESIREDGKKESCHATCEPYGTYIHKVHVDCSVPIVRNRMSRYGRHANDPHPRRSFYFDEFPRESPRKICSAIKDIGLRNRALDSPKSA